MKQYRTLGGFLCICITISFLTARTARAQARNVFLVSQTEGQTDFQTLGFGQSGYYFPQFTVDGNPVTPVTERPTDENAQFSPPSWAGFQFDSTQSDRTFSLDAGCFSGNLPGICNTGPNDPLVFGVYSKGGQSAWKSFTLPDGTTGLSGAAVDEAADNNSNNSVNRIQLGAGTPSSFLLRIVVDNTNQEHDTARLNPRGTDAADTLNPNPGVNLLNLTSNGLTDVYTFRYDNFIAGDFIKIKLNSGVAGEAPSIGGIMFDTVSAADFDSDSDVDGKDFLTWQRGLGVGTTRPEGDADSSLTVDGADLALWENQFGTGVGPLVGITTSVPEPTSLITLALGLISLIGLDRRRRKARAPRNSQGSAEK